MLIRRLEVNCVFLSLFSLFIFVMLVVCYGDMVVNMIGLHKSTHLGFCWHVTFVGNGFKLGLQLNIFSKYLFPQ